MEVYFATPLPRRLATAPYPSLVKLHGERQLAAGRF